MTHPDTEAEREYITEASNAAGPCTCEHGSAGRVISVNGLFQQVCCGINTTLAPGGCEKAQQKQIEAA